MASPEIPGSNFGNYTIQGIEEIVLPPAVSWLPSTFAWKLLGVVVCGLLAILLLRALRKWRANEYRRVAISKIDNIRISLRSNETRIRGQLREIPELMKTAALHAYPREDIASLSGESWLAFLRNSCKRHSFDRGSADALLTLAYQSDSQAALSQSEAEILLDQCERWIRRHETPSKAKTRD